MEITRYTPQRLNDATLIHDAETGSAEWARHRKSGIGGSDIGVILGLNEYKSAYQLWAERIGLIDVEPVNNWSVRFGKAFEMPILQMWAEDNPEWEVFTTGTYCDNTYNFLQASPDALVSFAFNAGLGNLQRSQIRIRANRGDWEGAADAFRQWTRGGGKVLPGLVRRRESEIALFLS